MHNMPDKELPMSEDEMRDILERYHRFIEESERNKPHFINTTEPLTPEELEIAAKGLIVSLMKKTARWPHTEKTLDNGNTQINYETRSYNPTTLEIDAFYTVHIEFNNGKPVVANANYAAHESNFYLTEHYFSVDLTSRASIYALEQPFHHEELAMTMSNDEAALFFAQDIVEKLPLGG